MKKYIVTEYITLIKSYVVEAKNKKNAYNNFLKDENIVEELEDDYEENYQPLKIEEFKKFPHKWVYGDLKNIKKTEVV
jgi:hypothetical protein